MRCSSSILAAALLVASTVGHEQTKSSMLLRRQAQQILQQGAPTTPATDPKQTPAPIAAPKTPEAEPKAPVTESAPTATPATNPKQAPAPVAAPKTPEAEPKAPVAEASPKTTPAADPKQAPTPAAVPKTPVAEPAPKATPAVPAVPGAPAAAPAAAAGAGAAAAAPVIPNCQASFTYAAPPTKLPINFETIKSDEWFRYQIASLSPCHMDTNDCAHAYDFITHLAGAVGSVTQLAQTDAGEDTKAFLNGLATSENLNMTINDHSPCIGTTQEGGVDKFLRTYAARVKEWYATK